MKRLLLISTLVFSISLWGCKEDSDDSSNGSSLSCDTIPACYSDTLSALEACIPENLTLNPVTVNSGVAQDASCTQDNITINFSDFGGSVTTPSTTTLLKDGTMCAKLQMVNGTRVVQGEDPVTYIGTIITLPGKDPVSIDAYEDGTYRIECTVQDSFEVSPNTLSNCSSDIAIVQMTKTGSVQQDNITQLGANYVDIAGQSTPLFSCQ